MPIGRPGRHGRDPDAASVTPIPGRARCVFDGFRCDRVDVGEVAAAILDFVDMWLAAMIHRRRMGGTSM